MPFEIVKSDILSINADAVVYADTPQPFSLFQFNPFLLNDKGREVLHSREAVNPILIGQAKITPVTKLEAGYVIHTSAPVWHGGRYHELEQLRACYEKSFQLALDNGCESIALPIIATDKLGYMKSVTQKMALDCIREFVLSHDMTVFLLLAGKTGIMLPGSLFTDVTKYIRTHYVETKKEAASLSDTDKNHTKDSGSAPANLASDFIPLLQQWMNKKNLPDSLLAKKANLTLTRLTDILNDNLITLPKNTAAALGMALELTLEEMKDFLSSAGYSISHQDKFDVILEFCITKGMYDVFEVNQILFRFEQEQLL